MICAPTRWVYIRGPQQTEIVFGASIAATINAAPSFRRPFRDVITDKIVSMNVNILYLE